MLHFVYELIDPRANIVVYVGITNNPNKRLLEHLSDNIANGEKYEWIESLRDENFKPRMRIIEIVETREEAIKHEKHWIHHYQGQGFHLMNLKRYEPRQKTNKKPNKQSSVVNEQHEKQEDQKAPQHIPPISVPDAAQERMNKRRREIFSETKELYYTSGEAAERLKITKYTFHYLVRKGEIPQGVTFPLRKRVVYRKVNIDKLAKSWQR